jgi:hypothetical protein
MSELDIAQGKIEAIQKRIELRAHPVSLGSQSVT